MSGEVQAPGPEEGLTPESETEGRIKGIAITDYTHISHLRNHEILPLGSTLDVWGKNQFAVRFLTNLEKLPAGGEGYDAVSDYVRFRGHDDHLEVDGESYVAYHIAPAKIQGEWQRYEARFGVPGVSDAPIYQIGKALHYFRYMGSPIGHVINEYSGVFDSRVGSAKQLRALQEIDERLRTDAALQGYRCLQPLMVGPSRIRELRYMFDYRIRRESYNPHTGESLTGLSPYLAESRTVMFIDTDPSRPKAIMGGVVAVGEDGLVRFHELSRWRYGYSKSIGSGKSRQIVQVPMVAFEDMAKWCGILESSPILSKRLDADPERSWSGFDVVGALQKIVTNEEYYRRDAEEKALEQGGFDLNATIPRRRLEALALRVAFCNLDQGRV